MHAHKHTCTQTNTHTNALTIAQTRSKERVKIDRSLVCNFVRITFRAFVLYSVARVRC